MQQNVQKNSMLDSPRRFFVKNKLKGVKNILRPGLAWLYWQTVSQKKNFPEVIIIDLDKDMQSKNPIFQVIEVF